MAISDEQKVALCKKVLLIAFLDEETETESQYDLHKAAKTLFGDDTADKAVKELWSAVGES